MESSKSKKLTILFILFLQKIQIISTRGPILTNNTTCVTTNNQLQEINRLSLIFCVNNTVNPSQVKVLQFTNSKLLTLSGFAFKSFSNVSEIHLNGSGIQEVQIDAFAGNKKLRNLYLNENQLTSLYSGCFNSLESLETLDLSKNNLQSLEAGAFNNLKYLKILNLTLNNVSDLSHLQFYNSGNVQILDLSYNRLTVIHSTLLSTFKSLHKLFINNNKINNLRLRPYDDYEKLQYLDASFNEITYIQTPDFIEINLNNNPLGISINMGDDIVHISKSNIVDLIVTSSDTKFLNASWNRITNLRFSNFQNARGLIILDLSHNAITMIDSSTFNNAKALTHLNLTHNLLMTLKYETFDELVNLETLDISYNRFHHLYENPHENFFGFCNLIRLQKVILYGNPWSDSILERINTFKQMSLELYESMNTTTAITTTTTTTIIAVDETNPSELIEFDDSYTTPDKIIETSKSKVNILYVKNKSVGVSSKYKAADIVIVVGYCLIIQLL